jgi:hypothetical protein
LWEGRAGGVVRGVEDDDPSPLSYGGLDKPVYVKGETLAQ